MVDGRSAGEVRGALAALLADDELRASDGKRGPRPGGVGVLVRRSSSTRLAPVAAGDLAGLGPLT